MKHKPVVVKVDIVGGGLDIGALAAALDEPGWLVYQTQTSTPGSILVILQKDE